MKYAGKQNETIGGYAAINIQVPAPVVKAIVEQPKQVLIAGITVAKKVRTDENSHLSSVR